MDAARKTEEPAREPWATVEEAGRQIGKSRLAVLNLVIKGDLVGEWMAGRVLIRQESIDLFLQKRDAARPKAKAAR